MESEMHAVEESEAEVPRGALRSAGRSRAARQVAVQRFLAAPPQLGDGALLDVELRATLCARCTDCLILESSSPGPGHRALMDCARAWRASRAADILARLDEAGSPHAEIAALERAVAGLTLQLEPAACEAVELAWRRVVDLVGCLLWLDAASALDRPWTALLSRVDGPAWVAAASVLPGLALPKELRAARPVRQLLDALERFFEDDSDALVGGDVTPASEQDSALLEAFFASPERVDFELRANWCQLVELQRQGDRALTRLTRREAGDRAWLFNAVVEALIQEWTPLQHQLWEVGPESAPSHVRAVDAELRQIVHEAMEIPEGQVGLAPEPRTPEHIGDRVHRESVWRNLVLMRQIKAVDQAALGSAAGERVQVGTTKEGSGADSKQVG